MRYVLLAGYLFIAFFTSAQSQNDSNTIRVLTFNILHGATTRGDFDLDHIAKVINDVSPDLVALQEVDNRTRRARDYDLVSELALRTGLNPLFGRAMYYDGGEYGEAILSRWSFYQTRNISLPYFEDHEPRTALEATVITDAGDTVSFIGTHLDHLGDPTDRIAQVERINEVFLKNMHPTILAGDLNDVPGSEPIRRLEAYWHPTYDKDNIAFTYSSEDPVKKIDYIMVRPDEDWEVVENRVICDTIASDHCAYLAVLSLRRK